MRFPARRILYLHGGENPHRTVNVYPRVIPKERERELLVKS
jgi:hypothetical protein